MVNTNHCLSLLYYSTVYLSSPKKPLQLLDNIIKAALGNEAEVEKQVVGKWARQKQLQRFITKALKVVNY